ncbi:hypothetical protein OG871_30070 [Kitasatospora sp. NBC_00374]|uniref:hypothetical protein n=1 Tax=Kitasatospora sp. NBC_00374 TaxID=2975964 RepID=UPI0032548F0E
MTRSKRASRRPLRLRGGLAATGLAAALLTALPAAPASASQQAVPGAVLIQNAGFRGYVLCANADNESVYVKPIDTRDRFCTWVQISSGPAQIMYNVGKDQVMAYTGGNEGAVVMEDEKRTPSGQTPNTQLWSWGGEEGWGGLALQSYSDSGQNVDAKATDGDYPRTDAVRTRGWRHGHQRELTWNPIPLR